LKKSKQPGNEPLKTKYYRWKIIFRGSRTRSPSNPLNFVPTPTSWLKCLSLTKY